MEGRGPEKDRLERSGPEGSQYLALSGTRSTYTPRIHLLSDNLHLLEHIVRVCSVETISSLTGSKFPIESDCEEVVFIASSTFRRVHRTITKRKEPDSPRSPGSGTILYKEVCTKNSGFVPFDELGEEAQPEKQKRSTTVFARRLDSGHPGRRISFIRWSIDVNSRCSVP